MLPERPQRLQRMLLHWYDNNRRDLPWRRTNDPYRIWLSEIMLQQTRVAAVVPYYERFLERFPDLHSLAKAPECDVLALWSGLGYYRRARMLHAAAKKIANDFAGEFPRSAAALRELPGIGRYTAAAIASIAFGESVAVVDGNVERVISRLAGRPMTAEACWQAAQKLCSAKSPGDFNQAMMELGAMVCTPKSPACASCPLRTACATRGELEAAPKPKRRTAELRYELHVRTLKRGERSRVWLAQRPATSRLMPLMWELPSCDETRSERSPEFQLKHSITDTDYHVSVYRAARDRRSRALREGRWFEASEVATLALTGVTRKILRRAKLMA